MKSPKHFLRTLSSSTSGMALLMVLAAIVVVSSLVLAFLATAKTEHRSATGYSDIVEAGTLAELPVNLAIGQIRKATEQNGMSKTWASQPGMIRVFGTEPDPMTEDIRSKTTALYKLYSDDEMVVTKGSATATSGGMNLNEVTAALNGDQQDLADWQAHPGMYVDINEPAAAIDQTTHKVRAIFPIVDPRATFAEEGGLPVDGFQFDDKKVPGTVLPTSEDDGRARLPMPVKWLYVLADGQLVTPKSGGTTELQFKDAGGSAAAVPTAANPIVGRVAFWTDDESTKINVNTAVEGTPWDTARAHTAEGLKTARRQPAQNEFSRYPGHPAMTSLSPVFQAFNQQFIVNDQLSETDRAIVIERYHRLSPRAPWGGTKAGSISPSAVIIANKDERLYSTLDELLFDRNRGSQSPALTEQNITTGRFFLTAHSRAPELNLFNQPRVMLWPISAEAAHRNAKDKLLAFVGSGGGKNWYFSRTQNFTSDTSPGSAQDPKADLNLDSGGGSAGAQRNRELYENYLVPLTGGDGKNGPVRDIPGFAGNFVKKYSDNRRNQILTQMFDFMRWSVNSYSTGLSPNYTYLPARVDNRNGESSAVPLIPGNRTKGFGRWPTITEATIVFLASHQSDNKTSRIQAFIVLEPFSPAAGQPSWSADLRYRISGLDQFTVSETPLTPNPEPPPPKIAMGFPALGTMHCNIANGWLDGGGATGFAGIGAQFKKANRPKGELEGQPTQSARLTNRTANENDVFPFYSNTVALDLTKETFDFSGGVITVEILDGFSTAANAQILQRIQLNFPPVTLKKPRFRANFNTLANRFQVLGGDLVTSLIGDGDITRSVEVEINSNFGSRGDLRLLAAMREVPFTWFTTHPLYGDRNVERLHFLRQGNQMVGGQYGPTDNPNNTGPLGKAYSGSRTSTRNTAGTLIEGVTYSRDATPAVVRGQNGAWNHYGRLGDFDNGIGRIEDGPYINKGDENNSGNADPSGDYFSRGGYGVETTGLSYSPNRQIASAVAFGSLPSGIYSDQGYDLNNPPHKPWQTLLFCPNPASRTTVADQEPNEGDHEGFKGPRDHLWLDLFWMPVVEPYAISESFATAGKVNMNHQLQPFTHIERSTGMHAVLKPTTLTAITPRSVGGITKAGYNNSANGGENYKEGTVHKYNLNYQVNRRETLKGLKRRFDQGDVYRSASEICEIFLVPQRVTGAVYNSDAAAPPVEYKDMLRWWNGNGSGNDAFQPTGDNSREAPYNQLYPRLTTKSNTFTVHYRVQTLKKSRSTAPAVWVEKTDSMIADQRGSVTLERYIDPHDPALTSLTSPAGNNDESWDAHYRFRIIERKTFSP